MTRPNEKEVLLQLFNKIYNDAHSYVQEQLVAKMKILEAMYIRQCIDLLEGLMMQDPEAPPVVFSDSHLEKLFLFSLMWSLGSVLELEARHALQSFVVNHPSKCDWPKCKVYESFVLKFKGRHSFLMKNILFFRKMK